MPENKPPIGVKDSDLAAIALGLVSAPDLRANRVDRFFSQVQAIAESRAQSGWSNEVTNGFSVFIHATYPRTAAKPLNGVPIADLEATQEKLVGHLFLLNGDASQGYRIPLPTETPGQLLEWLADQPFCDEPTVVMYRETNILVERAKGASTEATRKQVIRDKPPAATKEDLLKVLDLFHQNELITPTICPSGVWLRGAASKYYVGEEPERSIQAQMRTFLNAYFRKKLRAECEDTIRAGRIDIRLLIDHGGVGLTYWAIVELKVIKSFVHTADANSKPSPVQTTQNAEGIAEGLRQA